MPIINILQAHKIGAWGADLFPGYGTIIRPIQPIDNPNGVDLPKEMTEVIRLDPDFPRIPHTICDRISNLYVEMLNRGAGGTGFAGVDSAKEVSVVLLRDEATLKNWRCLVPTQVVGGASVNADYDQPLCDIETGEEIKVFPPEGWLVAGTSHSHNTMGAFFSGTDDRNELPQPGVHFVLGQFQKNPKTGGMQFAVAMSIVYHGVRYLKVMGEDQKAIALSWDHICDFAATGVTAHENVFNYVKMTTPPSWDHTGFQAAGRSQYPIVGTHGYGAREYYEGFGYGAGYHRHPDFQEELEEIDGDITEEAFAKWLVDFELGVSNDRFSLTQQHKAKPRTPILVFTQDPNDSVNLPYEQRALAKSIWAIRQISFGEKKVDSGLVYRVEVDGKTNYYGRMHYASDEFHKMEVIQHSMFGKVCKAQRKVRKNSGFTILDDDRDDDVMESNGVGTYIFETRGVSSDDFTTAEIEQLVMAWSSNLKQRSDLRIAMAKAFRKEGGSKR